MSHIDSYAHEIIGLFGGLPVYHPLEDIAGPHAGAPADDFGCTTDQLVIGGGPGEHPGLVLCDPGAAVADFAAEGGGFELTGDFKSRLWKLIDSEEPLHFAGWSTPDHHGFFEICISAAMPNPFDPEGDVGFDDWLRRGLGEFVYYAMPQLAQELVDMLKPLAREAPAMQYNNVLLIPPKMPVYATGGNAFFKEV